MRLYLDACAIIYAIEGAPPFRDEVLKWIGQAENSDDGTLITSRLSFLECRIKPLRDRDEELLKKYGDFFGRTSVAVVEIDAGVIDRATTLRVEHGFKTPDAIHLASALEHDANRFLTGDAALSRCAGLKVQVLQG